VPGSARALLNIISGYAGLTAERSVSGAPSEEFNDCAIGYMFQDDRLLPWRMAIRNVEFASGRLIAGERARRRMKC
jgi:ABC-type nitrate/sulfonate/bicarbonate transport system ATPase subunit